VRFAGYLKKSITTHGNMNVNVNLRQYRCKNFWYR